MNRAPSALGAVLTALAPSACCIGPVALLGLGVGGAWGVRLAALEPYRPLLIGMSVALLAFAFYRAYRTRPSGACTEDGSCSSAAQRLGRGTLWIVSPLILALLALPSIARHLSALRQCGHGAAPDAQASSDACCEIPTTQPPTHVAQAQTMPDRPVDPARQIIFNVESLQCPAVKGVGCGSMLAPVLGRIDHVDGVSRSFSNWTGTRLRIAAAPGADVDAVAEKVRALLWADGHQPVRVNGSQFTQALQNEDWHSAARLIDLSSYEFHIIAKRRLSAFADSEKLDGAKRQKLLTLADQLWDESADGLEQPGEEPGAYGRYWRSRLDRFVGAYINRARDVLTSEQAERLLRQYRQRKATD